MKILLSVLAVQMFGTTVFAADANHPVQCRLRQMTVAEGTWEDVATVKLTDKNNYLGVINLKNGKDAFHVLFDLDLDPMMTIQVIANAEINKTEVLTSVEARELEDALYERGSYEGTIYGYLGIKADDFSGIFSMASFQSPSDPTIAYEVACFSDDVIANDI